MPTVGHTHTHRHANKLWPTERPLCTSGQVFACPRFHWCSASPILEALFLSDPIVDRVWFQWGETDRLIISVRGFWGKTNAMSDEAEIVEHALYLGIDLQKEPYFRSYVIVMNLHCALLPSFAFPGACSLWVFCLCPRNIVSAQPCRRSAQCTAFFRVARVHYR